MFSTDEMTFLPQAEDVSWPRKSSDTKTIANKANVWAVENALRFAAMCDISCLAAVA